MKTIDLFCASPASTAICTSIDQRTIVRHATRPIDRHHHHHLDDRRKTRAPVPRSSQPPFDPKFRCQNSRYRSVKQSESRRKSSAGILDLSSPPGSSRYLLSDTPFIDYPSISDQVSALIPSQAVTARPQNLHSNGSLASKFLTNGSNYYPSLTSLSPLSNDPPVLKSSSTLSRPCNQVVELRVSIHCKGCEGKVRRHISRMEGVTSFNIDLATKKVTIVGDVTPFRRARKHLTGEKCRILAISNFIIFTSNGRPEILMAFKNVFLNFSKPCNELV